MVTPLTTRIDHVTPGDIVTAVFRPYMSPDIERSGIVVLVDDDDGVLVDFGPVVGHRSFRLDGNERTSSRWGARIVGVDA